jgi:hypothetical protein
MDLFVFYAPSGVLLCKPCGYAVPPTALATHISNHHLSDARDAATSSLASSKSRKPAKLLADYLCERFQLLDPATAKIPTPPSTDPPISELQLHRGYQCTRCKFIRLRTKTALVQMGTHFNQHRLLPRKKGGRQGRVADVLEEDKGPAFQEIYCQRFFVSGAQSSFFTVNVPNQVQELVKSRPQGHADVYRALVDEQLAAGIREQDDQAQIYNRQVSKTKVSPWLEMTRWPRYFHGLNMANVAPLAYAANPITEPALVLLGESFDRLIESAHQSIREDKISVFDQAQINSFIAGRSGKHDRMLMVKLAKSTFRKYKSIWKRLLCFVYWAS